VHANPEREQFFESRQCSRQETLWNREVSENRVSFALLVSQPALRFRKDGKKTKKNLISYQHFCLDFCKKHASIISWRN
jgi:hypothetical protein